MDRLIRELNVILALNQPLSKTSNDPMNVGKSIQLEHVIIMRISCFDTDLASEANEVDYTSLKILLRINIKQGVQIRSNKFHS